MIYSNNTYDITADISTYTRRDFKQVFDTTQSKWYMLNNLNEYEEYGIYGDSLSGTYYVGKLVVVNDEEYEWDGTQWVDLGTYVEVVSSVYRDASHTGYITFPYNTSEVASIEATFMVKFTDADGFLIGSGNNDSNDWRVFCSNWQSSFYYDCGNARYSSNGSISLFYNIKRHLRFDGAPMRLYDYDSQTYLHTGGSTRPSNSLNIYIGYSDFNRAATEAWGNFYDIVLYSDNGETAIAHYIPYVQNGVAGLYDTMNNTFLAPTGVMGAEYDSQIPKEYTPKAAPTITNVWPSKWYHNSTYMYKLMRNDAEQVKLDYMSDDKFKKVL